MTNRERVRRRRNRVRKIKLKKGCADCRTNKEILHFDHLPEFIKVADISALVISKCDWAEVVAEMAKCDVVCVSCHSLRTYRRKHHFL
jgi:hypothetical protein